MRTASRILVRFGLLVGAAGFLTLIPYLRMLQAQASLLALSVTATSFFLQDAARRVRLLIAALAGTALLTFVLMLEYDLRSISPWPDAGFKLLITAASVAAAFGLSRRAPWGRWLVLALGLGGLATGLMNFTELALFFSRYGFHLLWHFLEDEPMPIWSSYVLPVGAFALLSLAGGAQMKRAFSKPLTPLGGNTQPLRGSDRLGLILGGIATTAAILSILRELSNEFVSRSVAFTLLTAGYLIVILIPFWVARTRSAP